MTDQEIINKISLHIKKAYSRLDRTKYQQEPAYVNALMGRLSEEIYNDNNGKSVEFKTTIINDRGPGSAESTTGADFAITFERKEVTHTISKAILGQAKNDLVTNISNTEKERLLKQCNKMLKYTNEYVVLEAPINNNIPPTIRIGNRQNPSKFGKKYTLDEYILKKLIACNHGDKRDDFVKSVQNSSLESLQVLSIITKGLNLEERLNLKPYSGPEL